MLLVHMLNYECSFWICLFYGANQYIFFHSVLAQSRTSFGLPLMFRRGTSSRDWHSATATLRRSQDHHSCYTDRRNSRGRHLVHPPFLRFWDPSPPQITRPLPVAGRRSPPYAGPPSPTTRRARVWFCRPRVWCSRGRTARHLCCRGGWKGCRWGGPCCGGSEAGGWCAVALPLSPQQPAV